jgi:hypothetical protein
MKDPIVPPNEYGKSFVLEKSNLPLFAGVRRMLNLMESRIGHRTEVMDLVIERHTRQDRDVFYKLHAGLGGTQEYRVVVSNNLPDEIILNWQPYLFDVQVKVVASPLDPEQTPTGTQEIAKYNLKLCQLQCIAVLIKDIARQHGFTFVYDAKCVRAFTLTPHPLEMTLQFEGSGFYLHTDLWK